MKTCLNSLRLGILLLFCLLLTQEASAYYSPKLGRWISRDPMGEAGGFNLYAYCGNDPVNRWDYLGLEGMMVIRHEEDLKHVLALIDKGYDMWDGLTLVKGFKEDGSPSRAWEMANLPGMTSMTRSDGKVFGVGKLTKEGAVWFFNNPEHAKSAKQVFDGFIWMAIAGKTFPVVMGAGTSGFAGASVLPTGNTGTAILKTEARTGVPAVIASKTPRLDAETANLSSQTLAPAAAKTPIEIIVENTSATSKASKELAHSLLELGPRPLGAQAAHIVPTTGHVRNDIEAVRGFVTAQTKMDTYLPGMRNHGINGFWDVPGHAGTHKDIYYRALGEEFKDVFSWEDAVRALDNMRVRILAGEFK